MENASIKLILAMAGCLCLAIVLFRSFLIIGGYLLQQIMREIEKPPYGYLTKLISEHFNSNFNSVIFYKVSFKSYKIIALKLNSITIFSDRKCQSEENEQERYFVQNGLIFGVDSDVGFLYKNFDNIINYERI